MMPRRDGRSARRSGRTLQFATRVSPEFDRRLRSIAERDGSCWSRYSRMRLRPTRIPGSASLRDSCYLAAIHPSRLTLVRSTAQHFKIWGIESIGTKPIISRLPAVKGWVLDRARHARGPARGSARSPVPGHSQASDRPLTGAARADAPEGAGTGSASSRARRGGSVPPPAGRGGRGAPTPSGSGEKRNFTDWRVRSAPSRGPLRRAPADEVLTAQLVQRRHERQLPHDPFSVFRDHLVAIRRAR